MQNTELPIGVFDSGVGGLTVLEKLVKILPNEEFLFLGDTARLPYGTKSKETVIAYVQQASKLLVNRGIKCLVIACNTATAAALPVLERMYPHIPVIGVIKPGAEAACKKAGQAIGVIATESTVRSQGYVQAIKAFKPSMPVYQKACGLLVALAEEGWHQEEVTRLSIKKYLSELFQQADKPIDTLLLGCTHFPVFRSVIAELYPELTIVDSAVTTANFVSHLLKELQLERQSKSANSTHYLVTDAPERFQKVAHQFMKAPVLDSQIELTEFNQ